MTEPTRGRPAVPFVGVNAWDLFLRTFHVGDEIVLITEDDRWFWGILHGWTQDVCILRKPRRQSTREVAWENVAFMCHDGFPVSKLKGADGSASIELEEDIREGLRAVFSRLRGKAKLQELVIGDPHLIEGPVSAILYNQGNEGWDHYDKDNEEVMDLVSTDGAHAHLWQLDRVYHGIAADG